MRRTRHLAALVISSLFLGALLLGAPLASAAPPTAASGTITVLTNVPHDVKQVGVNTKTTATAEVLLAGTLKGIAVENYVAVTHPSGEVNLHGRGFFEGTVNGVSGSLEYVFHGNAAGGKIVIVAASGDLAGLRGQLPYQFVGGADYTYSGQIHLP